VAHEDQGGQGVHKEQETDNEDASEGEEEILKNVAVKERVALVEEI